VLLLFPLDLKIKVAKSANVASISPLILVWLQADPPQYCARYESDFRTCGTIEPFLILHLFDFLFPPPHPSLPPSELDQNHYILIPPH